MVIMKMYFFIAFMAIFALTSGVFVPPRPGHKKHNLDAVECTWGPSYWCKNLTSAAGCHAVHHCIDTVWLYQKLPPDTSNVCQICLDMVKQARDNLESNETQELIKEVFEGSCALIHLKPIVKECDKIADNYIPELIDTLASQMNPQVVCSVAGLCNNEKVHELLAEESSKEIAKVDSPNRCEGCHRVVNILEDNFNKMSKDQVLHSFLWYCGKLGSFSDGCSNIVITYFTEIYNHLQDHFNSNEVCLMSGECSAQFHTHATKVEITPMSHIGYVPVNNVNEDLPCELCEQLVQHLKELMIANTTELEFKQVAEGLCKQTGKFSDECISLVEQYYGEIYDFLVNKLNSSQVCYDIGICKRSGKEGGLIAPLLPSDSAKAALSLSSNNDKSQAQSGKSSVRILPPIGEQHQLPLELLMPPHTQVLYNKEVCVFCEYFLHYIQEAITDPKTEDAIKKVIEKACDKLPNSVNATCVSFVNNYEEALVALLAQEIDPSQICPLIKACPSSQQKDVEIFMEAKGDSKCPLCLLTVTKLESMVKSDKTKENIKNALGKLCHDLPESMEGECVDFVHTYTDELIALLISDLKPDEVCVYLKMCVDNQPASPLPPYVFKHVSGNIETNIIPDNTINGQFVGKKPPVVEDKPMCVICEFVMKEIEDELKDNKTDERIEQVVRNICKVLPSTVKAQCNSLVDEYGDTIIQLLIAALEPSEICNMIKLCSSRLETIRVEILECPICVMTIEAMEKILKNPKADHEIEHVLEKTCRGLPKEYRNKCKAIIEKHGKDFIDYIIHHESAHKICKHFMLCSSSSSLSEAVPVGVHHCTYGPSYWCQNEENADECNARSHCEAKVWFGTKPNNTKLLGVESCTWGPGYWCQTEQTANECGHGAKSHCETKVWFGSKPKNVKLVGVDHCSRGPGYWCQTEQTANECGHGAKSHCETKVWFGSKPKNVKLVGVDHCSRGPGYWCQSEETASECGIGARLHCMIRVWNNNISGERPQQLIGGELCVRGPGYWCRSEETADKCGKEAREYCETKVWSQPRIKRISQEMDQHPGKQKY